jgi:uncharacterized membrane-anchored protein YhcB (DUF1043 family)
VVHPATLIGSLCGVCAGIGLIVTIARGVLKNYANAQANTRSVTELRTEMDEANDKLEDHGARLAVLEDRDARGEAASRS